MTAAPRRFLPRGGLLIVPAALVLLTSCTSAFLEPIRNPVGAVQGAVRQAHVTAGEVVRNAGGAVHAAVRFAKDPFSPVDHVALTRNRVDSSFADTRARPAATLAGKSVLTLVE
ncbi:MAG: hypothetical protein V1792_24170, partial [Pseudomonadota bacterium]